MFASELTALSGDDFETAFGLAACAEGLHRALHRSPTVRAARGALASGRFDDNDVREFANHLLLRWEAGRLFPHDLSLAAIAVLLEDRFSDFADEYLHDLARLNVAELPKSSRVARISLKSRSQSTSSRSRRFVVGPQKSLMSGWRVMPVAERDEVDQIDRHYQFSDALCQS
jgi:hypothetical protein